MAGDPTGREVPPPARRPSPPTRPRRAAPAPSDPAPPPAYGWRGLLVDLCRHWIGPAALHRTIDAISLAGFNVLHLHLSDDQAHRVELPSLPGLHRVNPDGRFLSAADVSGLIEHARERSVRVVPEVDMPGHTTAWLVAHPELAAGDPPAGVSDRLGPGTAALDPDAEATFEFLGVMFDDLVGLFDDTHLHVGGDEVHAGAWPGRDARSTQARFTDRVVAMVLERGRVPVVWDEAWHPGLDRRTVVQVWRGHGRLRAASVGGWPVILSTPYYLDLGYGPAHHRVDPGCSAAAWNAHRAALYADPTLGVWAPLVEGTDGAWESEVADAPSEPDATRVLGGEACLWSELCPEELLDLRLWPTAAVVADVLVHGPAAPVDEVALAARLDSFEADLVGVGVDLAAQRRARWEDLAGGDGEVAVALGVIARCCEPTKWYSRHGLLPAGRLDAPFDRFVDTLGPVSRGVVDAAALSAAGVILDRVDPGVAGRLAEVREIAAAIRRRDSDPIVTVGEVLVIHRR